MAAADPPSPAVDTNGIAAEATVTPLTTAVPAVSTSTATVTPSFLTPQATPMVISSPAASKPSTLPTLTLQRSEPPKNLRGLNKPKCIKCGNVARSRCPFQSCKSCCAKAQNPCHIHVLKANATLADRSPSANSTHLEPPSDLQSSGPSNKAASIRQLSGTFAQFNNVHIPVRSRKPLTRKDAMVINQWRFLKLKEYRESYIEAENEAFDRYMQSISLLEEAFDVNSEQSEMPTPDQTNLLSGIKARLRCDPVRIDKFRKRTQNAVDQGLRKLEKSDHSGGCNDLAYEDEDNQTLKMSKIWREGKSSSLNELNEKLCKARNKEDLDLCLKMMSQIFCHKTNILLPELGTQKAESVEEEMDVKEMDKNASASGNEFDYSLLKLVRKSEIDQETLKQMDLHFSSLEDIEDL